MDIAEYKEKHRPLKKVLPIPPRYIPLENNLNEWCKQWVVWAVEVARKWYMDLWDWINGKKLPSTVNPWVFVIESKKIS